MRKPWGGVNLALPAKSVPINDVWLYPLGKGFKYQLVSVIFTGRSAEY